jgi:hypothetical protein
LGIKTLSKFADQFLSTLFLSFLTTFGFSVLTENVKYCDVICM